MAEEKVIPISQHDTPLLRQELKIHQDGCVEAQKRTEREFKELREMIVKGFQESKAQDEKAADRQIKTERILWIGLGVLATLQFMVPMIKYFVTLMGGSQ